MMRSNWTRRELLRLAVALPAGAPITEQTHGSPHAGSLTKMS